MFVSILKSRPNVAGLRAATKAAHDKYWETRSDRLKLAGPMLSDDGSTRVGQVLILDVPDKETAEQIVADDPFVASGVYESWTTYKFSISVG